MNTHAIWKFHLLYPTTAGVMMPRGAKVLSVGAQGEAVVLWALCETKAPVEVRDFTVLGTGFSAPSSTDNYLGTAHTSDGFVWHVFEGFV